MSDARTAAFTLSEGNEFGSSAESDITSTNKAHGKVVLQSVPRTGGSSERRLKVIQIGAGVTGIETAHLIQSIPHVDLTIYDKNPDLGGTWYENRYPACACDVPAHSYSYNWAPNPNWSRWIFTSTEIHQYLTDVAKKHGLCKYMRLSHKVTGAEWDHESAKWILSIEREVDGKSESFKDECDFLISGTGVLNNWKWPKIAGIDAFDGKLLHTASWDPNYDFGGKRVAVLGNGASAVQVVPVLRKELRKFLSPDFGVGCRRPTPADGFLAAIREKNVSVITKAATEITAKGILEDAKVNEYDAIVCATGFDTSFVPRFPIIGKNGVNLQDVWRLSLEAYMGLSVSGFPNYFIYSGPLSPIANGSVFPGTAMQSAYLGQVLSKMQKQNIKSLEVKQKAQEQYNDWAQGRMEDIVWSSGCRSWYQDEHGKIRVPFPGSLLHYRMMTEKPLFEHFELIIGIRTLLGGLGMVGRKKSLREQFPIGVRISLK